MNKYCPHCHSTIEISADDNIKERYLEAKRQLEIIQSTIEHCQEKEPINKKVTMNYLKILGIQINNIAKVVNEIKAK